MLGFCYPWRASKPGRVMRAGETRSNQNAWDPPVDSHAPGQAWEAQIRKEDLTIGRGRLYSRPKVVDG